jgi:AF4/FMR2 family protein 3
MKKSAIFIISLHIAVGRLNVVAVVFISKHKLVFHISVVVYLILLQVVPSAADKVTRQIQSKLGDYSAVRQILEDDSKRLIGIDGVPASPAPAGSQTFFPAAAARLQQIPEFKKPSTHQHGNAGNSGRNNHYHPHSAPRGGFVKPADGKPPHGGRGGYPGQPVKHGGGSNDHRSNGGIVPPKGPPQGGGGGSSNSRVQQVARTLPRLNVNQVSVR